MWDRLTVADAAKRIDKSERTLLRWIQQGRLHRGIDGRILEKDLIVAERDVRRSKRRARPPSLDFLTDLANGTNEPKT